MKKLIILVALIFGLLISAQAIDWYSYAGKKVIIELTNHSYYVGIVQVVAEMNICKQEDEFGNCIYSEIYYTLFLKTANGHKTIATDKIITIKEIE